MPIDRAADVLSARDALDRAYLEVHRLYQVWAAADAARTDEAPVARTMLDNAYGVVCDRWHDWHDALERLYEDENAAKLEAAVNAADDESRETYYAEKEDQ